MATAQTLPVTAGGQSREARASAAPGVAAENALVPLTEVPKGDEFISPDSLLARLPVELDVGIPVREFRVRHLLAMGLDQVIETDWAQGDDLPLAAGAVQLAWSEFEVMDTQLAVRITRLA
jgi:flagellar motor switch/type III secretory pathway protein FliN